MFNFFNNISAKLLALPLLIVSLTVHEFSHGFIAYKLGDPTAKNYGRLTLNPLKHLDPIGTLAMIFSRFGWARPVPINPRYFKNPKRGMAYSALAGPLSNFLMAFLGAFIVVLSFDIYVFDGSVFILKDLSGFSEIILEALLYFIQVNIVLMAFNFIPFPPLDGSKIVFAVLPDRYYYNLMQYERYGSLLLIAFVFFGVFDNYIYNAVSSVVGFLLDFWLKIL